MKQRDLVWIRFPFSNLQQAKARPALVVSHDRYNREHPDVLICAVTSNLEERPYKVLLRSKDLEGGEIPVESMVRADKIIQVETGLVDRTFARRSRSLRRGRRTHPGPRRALLTSRAGHPPIAHPRLEQAPGRADAGPDSVQP